MSGRFSSLYSVSTRAVLGMTLVWWCSGRAAEPQRGRPIEFSDPGSKQIVTNLNQLSIKRGGLRELEEDLYKPLLNFSPSSSLDGVVAPPVRTSPPPRIQSKKARELLERNRNWFLNSPEDLTTGPTAEDIFNLPEYEKDGKEKKEKSSIERYYERLDRERRTDGQKPTKEELLDSYKRADSLDDLKKEDDSTLPSEMTEQERELRRRFDLQPRDATVAPGSSRNSFSDVFGLGNTVQTPDQLEAHKLIMKQFEQFFSSSPNPLSGAELPNSLSGLTGARNLPLSSGLENLPGASRLSGFEATLGTINPSAGAGGLPDFSVKGLEPLSPPAAPPTPKVARPPSVMDFPQRKF